MKIIIRLTKAAVTILLLSILLPSTGLAQSAMISSRHLYNHDLPSSTNIVRSWKQKALITCSRNVSPLYSNTFYMRFANTSAATEVRMPAFVNPYGSVSDEICDIQILDNTCYFCGKRVYAVGYEQTEQSPYPVQILDSCAIVGYFSFTQWAEALVPDDSFYVYEIPDVKYAQKMAVYHPESGDFTAMEIVCLQDCAGYGPSCLVEMCNTAATPHEWKYNIVTPTDNSEILTYVIVTNSKVVTSSVNETTPQWVSFRQSENDIAQSFSNTCGLGKTQHIYHLSDRDGECADYGFETNSSTKVLLYPKGGSDGFIAGLSARIPNNGSSGLVLNPYYFLLFDMADVGQMAEYQTIHGTKNTSLKGLSYLSDPNAVGLLLSQKKDIYFSDSVYTYLLFPKLGVYNACDTYSDTLLRYNGGRIQSIGRLNSKTVCLGGIHWSGKITFEGTQVHNKRDTTCYYEDGTLPILRRHSLLVKEIDEKMERRVNDRPAIRSVPKQTTRGSTNTSNCIKLR